MPGRISLDRDRKDGVAAGRTGALRRNAVAFVPDGRPRVALVLHGGDGVAAAALPAGPAAGPMTLLLDPAAPESERASAEAAAAGWEVALSDTSMPPGATPAEIEVSLAASFRAVPTAVAVLLPDDAAASAAMPILAESGHGALVRSDRLGPRAAARRAAVPLAVARASAVLRRALDRAVLSSRRDGAAVVLVEPDGGTAAAIDAWRRTARGREVQLAPLSAILRHAP